MLLYSRPPAVSSRVAKPEKVGSERGRRFAFDVDANLMLVSVVVHAGVYLEVVLLEVFADPPAFFGLGEPGGAATRRARCSRASLATRRQPSAPIGLLS